MNNTATTARIFIASVSMCLALTIILASGASAEAMNDLRIVKRVDSLSALTTGLRSSAIQAARSTSDAMKLKGNGGTSRSGPSDFELDMMCGDDWFITYDEDAKGNPVVGSFNLHCADSVIPIA